MSKKILQGMHEYILYYVIIISNLCYFLFRFAVKSLLFMR